MDTKKAQVMLIDVLGIWPNPLPLISISLRQSADVRTYSLVANLQTAKF